MTSLYTTSDGPAVLRLKTHQHARSVVVFVDKIACMQADGHVTVITLVSGKAVRVSTPLEEIMTKILEFNKEAAQSRMSVRLNLEHETPEQAHRGYDMPVKPD